MSSIPNDQTIDQSILQKYEVLNKLGSGAYGHVWKVTDKSDNKHYALKKVYSAFHNDLDAQRTFRQISILKKIDHPNVVKLKKVFKARNDFDLYLVFQLVESDLFKAVKGNILSDVHKKYIIYQIAKSLKFVHSAGILHRDIKPSNILIDTECKIKLCDFGLSRSTFCYNSSPPVITQFIATRWYRAPEVMLGSQCYTSKADIWSLGCLIYEMYAYKALMPGKDNVDQIERLLQFKGFPNEQEKNSLKVNGIDKILSHFSTEKKQLNEYFHKIEDPKLRKLLLRIFQYDPDKRPTAEQILNHPFLDELKNYQLATEAQTPIQLQHNENLKLSAHEYKQMIYQNFAEKQVQSQKQLIENDKNHHRAIVERTLKKKSTHLIKSSCCSTLQPDSKGPQQNIQTENKCCQQKLVEKNIQKQKITQIKKDSVSLYMTEKQTQIQERPSIRLRKQQFQQNSLQNQGNPNFSPLIKKEAVNKFKKRTIKQNSLHHHENQDKENHNCVNTQVQAKFDNVKQKPLNQKINSSLHNSPVKRLSVSKKLSYDEKGFLSINKSPQSSQQKTNASMILPKKATKSHHKNSVSLHSPVNLSLKNSKNRLPQLIVKQRDKIVTKPVQMKNSKFQVFNDLTNIRHSQTLASPLKRQKTVFKFGQNPNILKKGIAQLYNRSLVIQN